MEPVNGNLWVAYLSHLMAWRDEAQRNGSVKWYVEYRVRQQSMCKKEIINESVQPLVL